MRTRYGKLCERHSSGDGASDDTLLSSRDQWILHHLGFLKAHIMRCPTRKSQALVSHPPVREQQPPSLSDTAPMPTPQRDEEDLKDSELFRQLEETSKVQRVELEQLREALTKVNKAETEIERVARLTGSYVADVIRSLPLAQAVRIRHKIVDLLQQAEIERMHTPQQPPYQPPYQPTYPPYQQQQYQPQYQGDQQPVGSLGSAAMGLHSGTPPGPDSLNIRAQLLGAGADDPPGCPGRRAGSTHSSASVSRLHLLQHQHTEEEDAQEDHQDAQNTQQTLVAPKKTSKKTPRSPRTPKRS